MKWVLSVAFVAGLFAAAGVNEALAQAGGC